MDLQSVQIIIAIIASLLVILGTIFGWFGKVWGFLVSFFRSKPPAGVIEVPKKTLILIPISRERALWWHMGSMGDQPAMQIVGDLNITNISNYDVFVMGAKLKKPKAIGHAVVREHDSDIYSSRHSILRGTVSDLKFDFFVQPPVCEKGKLFKANVAIIDHFGNEHWLKGLEFKYS